MVGEIKMVQSIWLQFDEEQQTPETVQRIIGIIRRVYKCYTYEDYSMRRGMKVPISLKEYKFVFLDYHQIKSIVETLNICVDDKVSHGNLSTDFEALMHFVDLNLGYGDLLGTNYFRLGRDVWGSVGMFSERLNVLRFILQTLEMEFEEGGIHSELSLVDCDGDYFDEGFFNEYFGQKDEN